MVSRHKNLSGEFHEQFILVYFTNACLNASSAAGACYRVEFLWFPHVLAHIPVFEAMLKLKECILTSCNAFKTRILTCIHLFHLFKVRLVYKEEAAAGGADCCAGAAGNTL